MYTYTWQLITVLGFTKKTHSITTPMGRSDGKGKGWSHNQGNWGYWGSYSSPWQGNSAVIESNNKVVQLHRDKEEKTTKL